MAGVAVGATVAQVALFAGPISGASMNPARSIGPALFAGVFAQLWIYLAAPLLGAALAVLAYRGIYGGKSRVKRQWISYHGCVVLGVHLHL